MQSLLAAALAAFLCALLAGCGPNYIVTVVGEDCYARRGGAGEGSAVGSVAPAGGFAAQGFSDVGCGEPLERVPPP